MKTLQQRIKGRLFLTDGGLETDFVFNKQIDLPHFAAFPLVENPEQAVLLDAYYREYMEIAKKAGTGFILESPTWRANPDWAYKLGYTESELIQVNRLAIEQLKRIRTDYENQIDLILISGMLGPRGDGYRVENAMTAAEASTYHGLQIRALKEAGADLISALTMNYTEEALGIVLAARDNSMPVVISFTVETDGDLTSGEGLKEAILKVDEESGGYPLYYMINCAHPSHFIDKLQGAAEWKKRIRGIRANASCKSHAELDESPVLDKGDAADLGRWHRELKELLPELSVFGGCCGTDATHVNSICEHVFSKVL